MKEQEYQAYIDDLHIEIDALMETIAAQANKLDEYEEAIIKAFKKWGEI